ncbi:hypothetical protein BG004_003473 [Podila humilis]|nr:hypothetical protein BG004_003473 [Podila humilis]
MQPQRRNSEFWSSSGALLTPQQHLEAARDPGNWPPLDQVREQAYREYNQANPLSRLPFVGPKRDDFYRMKPTNPVLTRTRLQMRRAAGILPGLDYHERLRDQSSFGSCSGSWNEIHNTSAIAGPADVAMHPENEAHRFFPPRDDDTQPTSPPERRFNMSKGKNKNSSSISKQSSKSVRSGKSQRSSNNDTISKDNTNSKITPHGSNTRPQDRPGFLKRIWGKLSRKIGIHTDN